MHELKVLPVEVTEVHIKLGIPRCPWACPIAIAVMEALDAAGLGHQGVEVFPHKVYFVPPQGRSYVARLSQNLEEFARRFDSFQEPIEPISSELVFSRMSD